MGISPFGITAGRHSDVGSTVELRDRLHSSLGGLFSQDLAGSQATHFLIQTQSSGDGQTCQAQTWRLRPQLTVGLNAAV